MFSSLQVKIVNSPALLFNRLVAEKSTAEFKVHILLKKFKFLKEPFGYFKTCDSSY